MLREVKKDKFVDDYDAVRIKLASPERIREWSYGEITKPETLNYRTHKPEKDGLFCERVFGPEKDFQCSCGKYKGRSYTNTVCDRCGVEVTTSRVRRTRMGHIELAVPVAHIWFVKSAPSKIGTLLDMTIRNLERVLYYESYIVLNPGNSDYEVMDLVDSEEYYEIMNKVDEDFEVGMGAGAIQDLLKDIDLEEEAMQLRTKIKIETSTIKKQNAIKKLKIIESFLRSDNKPEWMVFEVVPLLPPTLRPLVALEGGRFATSDLNDLYRRLITRNNRLKQLISIRAPEVILRNEKRMLQEAVDALMDNQRKSIPVKGKANRPLKSLTDLLKGKQGRFRQNLLGKRVDYSGRSVITVGPDLEIHQCGLPKDMAVELFKPFLIERLEHYGETEKASTAKKLIEKKQPKIWKLLEEVIKDYPILLNRAPTLHKLGIQGFMPVLTEDKAIKLHPMVCTPFNADFDGDQMAVYIPLTNEARIEAKVLMLASRNVLLPANGKLAMSASQDIVLGIFYLTMEKAQCPQDKKTLKSFSSTDEVKLFYERSEMLAHQTKNRIDIHSWIKFYDGTSLVATTVGRVLFNEIIPDSIGFQNYAFDKGKVNDLAMDIFEAEGQARTALYLDDLKNLGFQYATKSGMTFSFRDIIVPSAKRAILDETEAEIKEVMQNYMQGSITEAERKNRVIDKWKLTTDEMTKKLMDEVALDQDGLNSIHIMHISGARGGRDQIKQLGAMRGLMDKPAKAMDDDIGVVETPIISSFKEGLNVMEYFISTHGSRKGLADTALKTADAGYLTRRLVDVARNAVINEEDCGTIEGIEISSLKEGLDIIESLSERVRGRVAAQEIIDPTSSEVIVEANNEITNEKAKVIEQRGITSVKIRSVLTCQSEKGICVKCYGRNLATQKMVTIGEAVGVIAAQSIGEPGTQLTLRTFHVGGSVSTDVDISEIAASTDGVIRYVRMNVIRDPSGKIIARGHLGTIQILDEDSGKMLEEHKVEYAATVFVEDGQKVVSNTKLLTWDSYNHPIISTSKGKVVFENFINNTTIKEEFNDLTGKREITVIESKDRKIQPQIKIMHDDGGFEPVPLPINLNVEVQEGDFVYPGSILGKTSRITIKQQDITGGLPKVQELFEARSPKNKAILAEIAGIITIGNLTRLGRSLFVTSDTGIKKKYTIPLGKRIIVHQGDFVQSGDALSDGALDPHDVLRAKGISAAEKIILDGIQGIYRKQGVKIDDKHISIIIRQMMKKVKIINPGHSFFLEGEIVDKSKVMRQNKQIESEGGEGAVFEPTLLGITKASLHTDSWLSAASFQETTKILTQVSIQGEVDHLEGLKESIILGHKIPVGTGSRHYQRIINEKLEEGGTLSEILTHFTQESQEKSVDDLLAEI